MSLFSVGKMIVMKKFLSGIICVISISLVGCTLFIPSSIQLGSENVALQSNGKTTSAKIYDNKYTSQSNSGSSLNFFGSDMLSVWESKENGVVYTIIKPLENKPDSSATIISIFAIIFSILIPVGQAIYNHYVDSCLLYTSDAADERSSVDLGGRRIIKKKKILAIRVCRLYHQI